MPTYSHASRIFLGLSDVRGIGFKVLRDFGGVEGVEACLETFELWSHFASVLDRPEAELRDEVLSKGDALASTLEERNIHLVVGGDRAYPRAFKELDKDMRPSWFFACGDLNLLDKPAIAVVGTRDPSEVGAFLARYAVSTAAELRTPVVSGLAKGIDGIAHEWALESGTPNISVMATGILRTYPARHADLAGKIVDHGGVLISEYLPDASPTSEAFVWRNRLQAALSACVIAPEWKRSSGTAHTIRFARSFGRPTINLVAEGIAPSPDHGEASLSFTVPREHANLRNALVAARLQALEQHAKQAELFG